MGYEIGYEGPHRKEYLVIRQIDRSMYIVLCGGETLMFIGTSDHGPVIGHNVEAIRSGMRPCYGTAFKVTARFGNGVRECIFYAANPGGSYRLVDDKAKFFAIVAAGVTLPLAGFSEIPIPTFDLAGVQQEYGAHEGYQAFIASVDAYVAIQKSKMDNVYAMIGDGAGHRLRDAITSKGIHAFDDPQAVFKAHRMMFSGRTQESVLTQLAVYYHMYKVQFRQQTGSPYGWLRECTLMTVDAFDKRPKYYLDRYENVHLYMKDLLNERPEHVDMDR